MKFESLNNDKFAPFKSDEIQNAFKIVGGDLEATTYNHGNPDQMDRETSNGWHDGAGNPIDFKELSVAP